MMPSICRAPGMGLAAMPVFILPCRRGHVRPGLVYLACSVPRGWALLPCLFLFCRVGGPRPAFLLSSAQRFCPAAMRLLCAIRTLPSCPSPSAGIQSEAALLFSGVFLQQSLLFPVWLEDGPAPALLRNKKEPFSGSFFVHLPARSAIPHIHMRKRSVFAHAAVGV